MASSSDATMVTQQSVLAKTGHHSSAVLLTMIFEIAECVGPAPLLKVADQDHAAWHLARFLVRVGHIVDRRHGVDERLAELG